MKKTRLLAGLLIAAVALPFVEAEYAEGSDGGTVARTIEVGGLRRTYCLHVPPHLPKNVAVPLILAFHGAGSTPAAVEGDSRFSDLADREGFLAAYPEGIGGNWNDGRGVEAIPAQRDKVDDVGFVAALIDDVARDHKVDPKRVFATGISNGAIFSHHLGANLSSRIAAIAPVVGGFPEPLREKFRPDRPVSVLILQGVDDPLMPYGGGDLAWGRMRSRGRIIATDEAVKTWVQHNGTRREAEIGEFEDKDPKDGCRARKFTYSSGRDGTEVTLIRLEGAGHTWPGGSQYLPQRVIGKVCRDLDAAEVIWAFFKAHPRP